MVYRGRPSTGCRTCRERKIKCDERPDGCIKCEKRGSTCPGYDSTVDSFFLDETANVLAKAKKSKARAIAARNERDGISGGTSREVAWLEKHINQSPRIHILAPLIDQGINFFMNNYALGVDQPPITSKDYHKYLSTNGFHPLIATTMTALGIAGVANIYMDTALKQEATRWYLNSIKMANAALCSLQDVRNDSTLVAVNLLSIFEATFNDRTFSGWSNHVDGASSLIRLRGKDQLNSPAGRRLYMHTMALYTINCMGKGEPIPDDFRELDREIVKHLDTKDPRTAFYFLQQETNDLRATMLSQPTLDLRNIIEKARELETSAASIFERLEGDWQYETVPSFGQIPGVFGDYYHVYPTHSTAQTWNWVRYNRIYLHDIIRNCILAGFATEPPVLDNLEYMPVMADSAQKLIQLQSDIMASMPQFLHDTPKVAPHHSFQESPFANDSPQNEQNFHMISPASLMNLSTASRTPSPRHSPVPPTPSVNRDARLFTQNFQRDTMPEPPSFKKREENTSRVPVVRVSAGYSTLWSLYVAGSMPTASRRSQEFVLQCLDRVEREFGINQAKVFATALRYKIHLTKKGLIPFQVCPQYIADPPPGMVFPGEESEVCFARRCLGVG
ncbi:hypothetical protein GQ44DRAFT_404301 [Phaeosphaeriaceae sp. PMI808]|nr:hypothetical protein GQ44DRAFT_404301 [Phaeosphaeriaceae sp. PMI808]